MTDLFSLRCFFASQAESGGRLAMSRRGSLQAYQHAHVPSPRTPASGRAPPAYDDDGFDDDESSGASYED